MRVAKHPALRHIKQDKWSSVHLATGKFKPGDWTKDDQRVIASLLPSDITTLGQKGVTVVLKVLFEQHLPTWKKFNWFSRFTHTDMPRALANAAVGKFCAFCGKTFPRKDVCSRCYTVNPEAAALSSRLAAENISKGWHSNDEEFKAAKGARVRATRAAWSEEKKAEVSRRLKAASSNVDFKARNDKARATNQERYGVDNPSQRADVQTLKRSNQRAEYGVDHPSQRPEIADKLSKAWLSKDKEFFKDRAARSSETYKKKTGFTHNMRNPGVVEKRGDAAFARWGFENPASSPEVRQKIQDKWESKYGYREIFASPETQRKIRATMVQRYGVENPMGHAPFIREIQQQRKNPIEYKGKTYYVDSSLEADCFVRLKNKYGAVYTQYDSRYPAELKWLPDFYLPRLKRYVEVKGVYTLFHANQGAAFLRNKKKAEAEGDGCEWMVCESGAWARLPKRWWLLKFTEISRYLAEKTHKPEAFIAEVARKVFKGIFHIVDGNFIRSAKLTVFCATLTQHNSDLVSPGFLSSQLTTDSTVVLWDYEWQSRRTAAKKYLLSRLGLSKFSVGARKTEVEMSKLTEDDARFFQANHLQGAPRRGLCVRLKYRDRVVAAMVFSPIQSIRGASSSAGEYELIRFATVGRIPGAASKLFSAFVSRHRPTRIISYSDRQHFQGGVYQVLGFKETGRSKPDYRTIWSFVDYATMPKQATKRSNLAKIEGFDASLSEAENLKLLGLPKIYDCGKVKWEWFNDAGSL